MLRSEGYRLHGCFFKVASPSEDLIAAYVPRCDEIDQMMSSTSPVSTWWVLGDRLQGGGRDQVADCHQRYCDVTFVMAKDVVKQDVDG